MKKLFILSLLFIFAASAYAHSNEGAEGSGTFAPTAKISIK